MRKVFLLVIGTLILLTGCNATSNYRKVSDFEVPNYTTKISDISEGAYYSYWIQPGNKTERCELLIEGYEFKGKSESRLKSEDLHWDGNCRNGKVHGLGKMTVNAV